MADWRPVILPAGVIDGHVNDPVVTNTLSHTGTYSALAGLNPQQETFCAENNNEPLGDSSFYQQFTVPAGGGTCPNAQAAPDSAPLTMS